MAEALAGRVNGACALQGLRIETTDGRALGHVHDLRCSWRPGQAEPPIVEAVVFGRRGLLQRLGFQQRDADTVPWSAVRSIAHGVVVVDWSPPAPR